jgi:hypothetical protein
MEQPIRAWHIGKHGEIFAGRCTEEQMKQWFRELVSIGDDYSEADERIDDCFEEISQEEMDVEREWIDGDGKETRTTFRKEAEDGMLPCQISTTYN